MGILEMSCRECFSCISNLLDTSVSLLFQAEFGIVFKDLVIVGLQSICGRDLV